MKSNLYIPKKITVGFQNRNDTYTKKLAYVIYTDDKGILRKETSWNGWRDKKIEPVTFENKPQEGFILNKGVQRDRYWGSGRSVIRIYDSRDFEFEISVDNLMGILMHSDVSKRDIQEKCVFAWAGKDLVLLPVNSIEYQESLKYTEKQSQNVSSKELIKGATYEQKKNNTPLIYIGYFEWFQHEYENNSYSGGRLHKSKGKKHIFYDTKNKDFYPVTPNTISHSINLECDSDYSNLVDKFLNSFNAFRLQEIKLEKIDEISKLNKRHSQYEAFLELKSTNGNNKEFVKFSLQAHSNTYNNIEHNYINISAIVYEQYMNNKNEIVVKQKQRDNSNSFYQSFNRSLFSYKELNVLNEELKKIGLDFSKYEKYDHKNSHLYETNNILDEEKFILNKLLEYGAGKMKEKYENGLEQDITLL